MNKYGLKFKNSGEYISVYADSFSVVDGGFRFYKGAHRFDIYDVKTVLRCAK